MNGVFSRPVLSARGDPRAGRLRAARGAERADGGPAGVSWLEMRTATGPRSEPVVEQDAQRIARAIADARRRPGSAGPGTSSCSSARASTWRTTPAVSKRAGLPYELAGGGAFRDSEELAALLPLLAAVADPDDPVSFTAVAARSALRRGRRGALPPLPRSGGRFSFRAALPAGRGSAHRPAPCALLRGGRGARRRPCRPGAAISRLCARLGLDGAGRRPRSSATAAPATSSRRSPPRARSRPRASISPASSRSSTGMTRRGLHRGDERSRPAGADVVRLMTRARREGARGAGRLPRGSDRRRPSASASGSTAGRNPPSGTGGSSRERDDVGSRSSIARPRGWDAMCEIEEEFEEAEKIRLLYVAATRAADMLVVSTWRQGKSASAGRTWACSAIRSSPTISPSRRCPRPASPPPRPVRRGRLSRRRRPAAPRRGERRRAADLSRRPRHGRRARRARSRPGSARVAACPGGACSTRVLEAAMRDDDARSPALRRERPRRGGTPGRGPRRGPARGRGRPGLAALGARASREAAAGRGALRASRRARRRSVSRAAPEATLLQGAIDLRLRRGGRLGPGGLQVGRRRRESRLSRSVFTRRRSSSTPVTGRSSPEGPRARGYSS